MRVNKYLAHASGLSRREADNAISAGRIKINNTPATLGSQVEPSDSVTFDGVVVTPPSTYTYLMLHKPVGYVCSRRSQGGVPTIFELLPKEYKKLKAVGRLDKDSSGLLLLTDDGDFAHRMTHPSFHKNKTYEVALDKPLEPLHQQMISDVGVTLEDGVSKLMIEKIENPQHEATTELQGKGEPLLITMHEGRNRQIRRTFAALGYTVTQLHRTQFGNYTLAALGSGQFTPVEAA